jgi:hypothetical protein
MTTNFNVCCLLRWNFAVFLQAKTAQPMDDSDEEDDAKVLVEQLKPDHVRNVSTGKIGKIDFSLQIPAAMGSKPVKR